MINTDRPPSLVTNKPVRQAFLDALEDPNTREAFIKTLETEKQRALETLRIPVKTYSDSLEGLAQKAADVPHDHDLEEHKDARGRYLAAESMLLAYHQGTSAHEKAEHLTRFIKDALRHAKGQRPHYTHSRRSLLRRCFADSEASVAKESPTVQAALEHLSGDLEGMPDSAAPATPKASRRDLLIKAGEGAVGGYLAGGVAGRIVDPVLPSYGLTVSGADISAANIDMAIGAVTGAAFRYLDAKGIVIEEKKLAAEMEHIFKATVSYCNDYTMQQELAESISDPFLKALKNNLLFRMAFLSGLKAECDVVAKNILSGGVPSKEDIKRFLACDSILNAYKHGRNVGVLVRNNPKKIGTDEYIDTRIIPEPFGAETGNEGSVKWLVTYLDTVMHPDKPIQPTPYRMSPDFTDPDIRKMDVDAFARTAISHLYNLTIGRKASKANSPQRGVPALGAQEDNPAAREAIERVLPQYRPTRRELLTRAGKMVGVGIAAGSGVTLAVDNAVPEMPDISHSSNTDKAIKAAGGAALGALLGALYHSHTEAAFQDKKALKRQVEHVIQCAGEYCLSRTREPSASQSR